MTPWQILVQQAQCGPPPEPRGEYGPRSRTKPKRYAACLDAMPEDEWLTTRDVMRLFPDLAHNTVENWLRAAFDDGALEKRQVKVKIGKCKTTANLWKPIQEP